MNLKLAKPCHTCEATKPLRSFTRNKVCNNVLRAVVSDTCNACYVVWLLADLTGRRLQNASRELTATKARRLGKLMAERQRKRKARADARRAKGMKRHHILKKLGTKELERRRKISAALLLRNKQRMGGC